jgi:hypothetical protein
MKTPTPMGRKSQRRDLIAGSSWLAVPVCAVLAVVVVCCIHYFQNYLGTGESFAWFDGTSNWPSIAILLFAALLSIHFIVKTHVRLKENAAKLTEEFGLNGDVSGEGWSSAIRKICTGWGPPALVNIRADSSDFVKVGASPLGCEDKGSKINIDALWQRYLSRGQLWMRLSRSVPMCILYFCALCFLLPLFGNFSQPPIRGSDFRLWIILPTIAAFLTLTFVVIDAVLLHEGFLKQLTWKKTYWPDRTFEKYKYSKNCKRPKNGNNLADYWDILLIGKRTEAVGNLIYYPFVILSLLIVARLPYFGNWTWPLALLVALFLHFSLAFYAAWRLPTVARKYRDEVLARLKRRRRQFLTAEQRLPEATDTLIEEVQSNHRGAFSPLWEQPAVRALLLPSGGLGIATLLQYLPH